MGLVLFVLVLAHLTAAQFACQFFSDGQCSKSASPSAFPFVAPFCLSASNSFSLFFETSAAGLVGSAFEESGCRSTKGNTTLIGLNMCVRVNASSFVRCAPRARSLSSPIIGIVGEPETDCESKKRRRGEARTPPGGRSCFASYYSDWLYQAGARVVPLPWNITAEQVAYYGARLNGVLFTGGGLVLDFQNPYVLAQKQWFDFAAASAATNDPFLLWGTCQGFQLLNVLAANSKDVMCLECYDAEDISLPLNFTADASFSFFKQLSSSSWSALQHAPITMNFHHDGVDPGLYSSSSRFGLRRFFRMLSTNVDRKGRPFVSSVQGVLHPNIQGTQFHPERPAFEFSNAAGDQGLVHTRQSVATNNEIAIALVDQARMSNRSFASWDEAEAHLLYNYNPQFMGQSLMLYTY